MRFGQIDIPEEILDAQESGTLVIFAGAGISRDAPAGLPDFKGLVKKVGEESNGEDKPDQYLGKLKKDKKVDVHRKVRQILTEGNPQPNTYHSVIPRLFPKVAKLKIVTTNQDELFLEGVCEFRKDVLVYEAPALPVGDDFNGLVFLHGSVRQEPRRMVLTDADFSRAYLTEGWARRFLLKLFEKYTVLFIGYSHDDTVISYLARGLPADGTKRFALTCDKNRGERDKHWSHLGVEPIWYEKPANSGKPHQNQIKGLQKWADVAAMGSLEHRSRIITLAETAPPIGQEEIDYLKRRLRNPAFVKTFVEHAKISEWLSWIAKRYFIDSLFTHEEIKDNQLSENTSLLWARWLTDMGIGEDHVEALSIVTKENTDWNRILWFAVAQALHFHQNIPHERFNQWVLALLAAPLPSGRKSHFLGYVLTKCKTNERTSTALLLFERMTHATPKRRKWIVSREKEGWERIRWEVSFPEDDDWLREAWNKLFMPELGRFVDDILPIAEANLRLAYETTQSAPGDFDSFNYHRYHIASKEGDTLHMNGVVDVLIDAVRDCLHWMMANRVDEGISTARRYLRSDRALFQRLALDALATAAETASPDDLLTWILGADLIQPETESFELSQFLECIYPRASQKNRIAILERIEVRYAVSAQDEDDKKWVEQAHRAMLGYLAKAAPDCKETARRWNEAKQGVSEEQLPSGVPGERKEPKAEWRVPISRYTKKELLDADPATALKTYDELPKEDFSNRRPDQSGMANQIRDAITEDVSYGLRMAEALIKLNKADHPLWETILQGWRTASIQEAEWESLIKCLEENFEVLACHHSQAADFMKAAVDNENRRPPFAFLPRLKQLADGLWKRIEDMEEQPTPSDVDWVSLAISSTAGTLTYFWLHTLSWRRKESASAWRGLPGDYREQFDLIVDGDTYGAKMGQIIFAEQLHFLSYLDDAWARERMAPLFEFDADKERARRAWSGFATQGRMSPPVMDMLRSQFSPLFSKLKKFSDDDRRGLVQRIAAVIHYEGADWWRNEWLVKFIIAVTDHDLVEFTETLGRFWEANDEDKRKEAWGAWIAEYIQARKAGEPVHFSPQETGALAMWMFPFAFMTEGFVKAIITLPEPNLQHGHIFHRLEESDLPENAPKATLRLISWLLKGAKPGEFWEGKEVHGIVRRLINSEIHRTDLKDAIGDQCVKLGLNEVLKLLGEP